MFYSHHEFESNDNPSVGSRGLYLFRTDSSAEFGSASNSFTFERPCSSTGFEVAIDDDLSSTFEDSNIETGFDEASVVAATEAAGRISTSDASELLAAEDDPSDEADDSEAAGCFRFTDLRARLFAMIQEAMMSKSNACG